MSFNFVYVQICISGDPFELQACLATHLVRGQLDFSTIIPMPTELDFEYNNLVDTGYKALFGAWEEIAKYWLLKEAAYEFGYAFPLQSRSETVKCLRSLDCADLYVLPALRYAENLEKLKHGAASSWQLAHWGAEGNAEGTQVQMIDCVPTLWFVATRIPKHVLVKMSERYHHLDFTISTTDD